MGFVALGAPLREYVGSLDLPSHLRSQLALHLTAMEELLKHAFPDAYIYTQGSYSLGTMVQPRPGGEYDVDIVVERWNWQNALDAFQAIEEVLAGHDVYGKMPIDRSKHFCISLTCPPDTSGHSLRIEIVPMRDKNRVTAVADRDSGQWVRSSPGIFIDRFHQLASTTANVRSLVLILKHLRDLYGVNDELRSFLIVSLIVRYYEAQGSLMADLLYILHKIAALFSDPEQMPKIPNPMNPGEDLARNVRDYRAVRTFFIVTSQRLDRALADGDKQALRELFGPGFNYTALNLILTILMFFWGKIPGLVRWSVGSCALITCLCLILGRPLWPDCLGAGITTVLTMLCHTLEPESIRARRKRR